MRYFWSIAAAALTAAMALGTGIVVSAEEVQPVSEPTGIISEAATEAATEAAPTKAETVAAGWEHLNGKHYYRLEDGSYAVGETEIDGTPYLFGFSGAQKTEWQTVNGKRLYYDPETGEPVTGWLTYFGDRFYISPEEGKLTGEQEIDGSRYLFSEGGSVYTGFFTEDDNICYADPETGRIAAGLWRDNDRVLFTDENGVLQNGWQEQDGARYYIPDGACFARTGFFEVDGQWYFGTSSGLQTGEQVFQGNRVLFDDEECTLITGWYEMDGSKRYLEPATLTPICSTFADIEGDAYYFNAEGSALTGLQYIDGVLYGFSDEGVQLFGDQIIGDKRYHFDEKTGAAAIGAYATEDGVVRYGADGAQVFGWSQVDSMWYYTDETTGYVLAGWATVGDKEYQFAEDGKMISDGRLYNQFDPKWKEVKIGTSGTSMYSSACGIFSFCNAIFALNHTESDAVEVAQWAYEINAYRPGGSGTYREILYNNVEEKYGEELGFTLDGQIWGKVTDSRLVNHLLSGGVAVIHVSGHFMAITGYNAETGLYHVLESACSTKRGLEGDSWVTSQKMSSGYTNVDWFVLISNRQEAAQLVDELQDAA